MSGAVILERDGRVATLRLERPPLNILDLEALRALDGALAGLADDAELQVLLLRGGERAFSAGVAVQDHVPGRIEDALGAFHAAVRRLRQLPAITVAAVRGHCLGGGLEMASACDLVVAAEGSRFGVPEVKLGCYPPVAAALYPRLMGRHRALDLLLTGRTLDAVEAERLGLISRLVADDQLEGELESLVAAITAHSAAVTRLIKRAVTSGERLPFSEALDEAERLYLEELTATADMHEGIAAFLEKRPPRWQHR
ncbi:MAG TPA: enoyl-CoA hydratase-related protein [Thermoanaerobaculia bacterium]|nr:enoyl-CoA hydratase-related protein [Thermoanaerobaculia bacterium]